MVLVGFSSFRLFGEDALMKYKFRSQSPLLFCVLSVGQSEVGYGILSWRYKCRIFDSSSGPEIVEVYFSIYTDSSDQNHDFSEAT